MVLGGAAYAAWEYLVPHYHDVPQVLGTPMKQARNELIGLGYVVAEGDGAFSGHVDKGSVLRVDPAAGTRLQEGETVRLIPSLGPPPIPVPSVVGRSQEIAERRLTQAGFEIGKTTSRFSERADEGDVLGQQPSQGQAPRGSEIDLVISKGPPPRPIPAVVGQSVDAAVPALQAEGFEVRIEERFSDSAPRGTVMGQVPEGGTERGYGSPVTLTVSKGPERFKVASYIGMSEAEAVAAIEQDGLVANVQRVPGSVDDRVRGQEPKPGTVVRAGQTVTIFVA